jgi:predicted dithiol-disulfide oxidoreductase (DUF899 family)
VVAGEPKALCRGHRPVHWEVLHPQATRLRTRQAWTGRPYFVDGRGDEALGGLWAYLDITALGRQEDWEDSPEGYPQTPANVWIRRHDEYDAPPG